MTLGEDNSPQPVKLSEQQQFMQKMSLTRMILPVGLGVLAVGFLIYKQFDYERFQQIAWTGKAFLWVLLGLLLLVIRHFSYAWRMHALARGFFSFRKCLELIVIWEFSAALTPTSKGGPFISFFVFTQEKLPAGRTAAAILYTIVCDAGFMVLMLPFLLSFFGPPMLYPGMKSFSDVGLASGTFFITYAFMMVYWVAFTFFLFVRPQAATYFLKKLAAIPFLKKQEAKLIKMGDDFKMAAQEIRGQDWRYHFQVIFATFGAWSLKFAMINCLVLAVAPDTALNGYTQLFIYARMIGMYIIMAFSPTPGGAGLAEVAMAKFISDFVPEGIGVVIALLWRGLAYYGYLLVGAFVVPAWIAKQISGKKTE